MARTASVGSAGISYPFRSFPIGVVFVDRGLEGLWVEWVEAGVGLEQPALQFLSVAIGRIGNAIGAELGQQGPDAGDLALPRAGREREFRLGENDPIDNIILTHIDVGGRAREGIRGLIVTGAPNDVLRLEI